MHWKIRFGWRWINFFKHIYYVTFILIYSGIYILYYNLNFILPTDKYLNYFE